MSDTSVPTKPKRVLTEAQRLAFLKGREKRMANIMKKREEKLEAEQMEFVEEPVPARIDPEPEAKSDPDPVEEIQDPPKKKRRVATKIATPTPVPISPPTKIPDEPDMSSLPPIMTVEDRDMILNKFEEVTAKILAMHNGKSSNKENVSPRASSLPPSPPVVKRRKVSAPPPLKRPISSLQNVFNWA